MRMIRTFVNSFEDALREYGIPAPKQELVIGRFVRWGDKTGDSKYWAKMLSEDAIAFGDWSRGINECHFSDSFKKLSNEEKEKAYAKIEQAKKDEKEQRAKDQEDASREAERLLNNASDDGQSPYLEKKKVGAHGVKFLQNILCIPLRDIDGKVWSVQRILEEGEKRFLARGRIHGCFHVIGDLETANTIYIAEGYATGATIYEITNIPVIVAFSVHSLEEVYLAIKGKYPSLRIILVADNEHYKEKSVGLEKAKHLGKKYNLPFVCPHFKPEEIDCSDFNDLYIKHGADEVKRQIGVNDIVEFEKEVVVDSPMRVRDLLNKKYKPTEFLIDELIMEGLTLVCGRPKVGKSFAIINMLLDISNGRKFLGKFPTKKSEVFYYALEDTAKTFQKRIVRSTEDDEETDNMQFQTKLAVFDKVGIEKFENFLTANPQIKLVVIDTLQKVKPISKSSDSYAVDYEFLGKIKDIASKLEVAIIVIHHSRKASVGVAKEDEPDVFEKVHGSTAMTGTVDTMIMLERDKGDESIIKMHVGGREVENRIIKYKMEFEPIRFTLLDDNGTQEKTRTELYQSILNVLEQNSGETFTPLEVAEKINKSNDSGRSATRRALRILLKEGVITSPTKGKYGIKKDDQKDVTAVTDTEQKLKTQEIEAVTVNELEKVTGVTVTSNAVTASNSR